MDRSIVSVGHEGFLYLKLDIVDRLGIPDHAIIATRLGVVLDR